MIRRIATAYYVELVKSVRQVLPFIGIALVIGAVVAGVLVHPVLRDGISDFAFIGYAAPAALNVVGFLMLLVYGANLVASETESGVSRMILIRPLFRREYIAAKVLNALTYAVILSFVAALFALGIALIFGELTGIQFGDTLLYSGNEMYGYMALAMLLNLAPQFAGAAYAIMFSTLANKPSTAVSGAVGVWLLMDYLKHPLGLAPFVFTTYLEQTWIVFADRCNALPTSFLPEALYGLGTSAAWFVVCTSIALFAVRRKNFGP